MAKQLRITEFVVEGTGVFPADMLRYDACYPADGEAVTAMTSSIASWITQKPHTYVVKLRHRDIYAGWSPTFDRWGSFGWFVDQAKTRDWVA